MTTAGKKGLIASIKFNLTTQNLPKDMLLSCQLQYGIKYVCGKDTRLTVLAPLKIPMFCNTPPFFDNVYLSIYPVCHRAFWINSDHSLTGIILYTLILRLF